MSTTIKNVIFDIGNVVLEWQPEHILKSVFAAADYTELYQQTFGSSQWQAYDQGVLTTKELKEQLALNVGCSITAIEALLQNVVIALRPIPEMVELIQGLKQAGYRVIALTNMPNDIFHSLLDEHAFWALFNDIVVSAQVKLAKPDPAIFELLLSQNQISAAESIFLDDSLDNVTAAAKLGFTTIKVINFQQAIDDLSELLKINS